MSTVRTIQATVANAIPIPTSALGKPTSALNKAICALEVREERLLTALQAEMDGIEDGAVDVFATARERGFLGT